MSTPTVCTTRDENTSNIESNHLVHQLSMSLPSHGLLTRIHSSLRRILFTAETVLDSPLIRVRSDVHPGTVPRLHRRVWNLSPCEPNSGSKRWDICNLPFSVGERVVKRMDILASLNCLYVLYYVDPMDPVFHSNLQSIIILIIIITNFLVYEY